LKSSYSFVRVSYPSRELCKTDQRILFEMGPITMPVSS
jgi:hypothetical protein